MKIHTSKGITILCDYCPTAEGLPVRILNRDLCLECLEVEGLI